MSQWEIQEPWEWYDDRERLELCEEIRRANAEREEPEYDHDEYLLRALEGEE